MCYLDPGLIWLQEGNLGFTLYQIQNMAKFEGFFVVLTPQMAISHLVRPLWWESVEKKYQKNLTPPWCVTILWFDPYGGQNH